MLSHALTRAHTGHRTTGIERKNTENTCKNKIDGSKSIDLDSITIQRSGGRGGIQAGIGLKDTCPFTSINDKVC